MHGAIIVMVLGLCLFSFASASQVIEFEGLRCTLDGATITALSDKDGHAYANATAPAVLGVLRHLDGELALGGLHGHGAAAKPPLKVTHEQFIGEKAGYLEIRLAQDGESGDIVIEQSGRTDPGLHGVQWGIAGIPLDCDIIVPGRSGLRLDRHSPTGTHVFPYPMGWEAQFVIVQGEGRGFWVWAEDAEGRFKTLRVQRRHGCWELAFETQNPAPFEDKTSIQSVRWRLGVYEGDWRVPARRYRDWAARNFGLTPLADQQPSWVKDIRLMVICGMGTDSLDAMAEKLDPAQTILYIPDWRRDGYDRNYPDYTAKEELAPLVKQAHELGFRVMLHVNYFGCDPKHALYEKFEPFQVRDPFSKEKLWWDWKRAKPPIKFAYINPACKAWRELFVSRMVELCGKYDIDSLHLDQTLCIWNDDNGPIDGMTMVEGSLAEHRELREALPHVALSGEGLNEVAFRDEAFAQRHVWGLSHTDVTWNRAWLESAHPVSSYIFRPYTIINGYLGMCSPTSDQFYAAWRHAYANWGVIPTFSHPSAALLEAPTGFARQLMDEAAFFQGERIDPDMDGEWAADTIFPYVSADGEPARRVRDRGMALVADGGREMSRTVTGVSEFVAPGSVPGWRGYDAERIFGLNTQAWYAYFGDARDMEAFHVDAMPPGLTLARVVVTPEMAAIEADDADRAFAWISDLLVEARCGHTVFGGEGVEVDGALTSSPGGAILTPAGRALIRLHPPWKAERKNPQTDVLEASGTGQVYAIIRLRLPDAPADGRVRFLSEVSMDEGAVGEGKTDGVTYIVEASSGRDTLRAEAHAATAERVPLDLDLTALGGEEVTLRIAADPGPSRLATFDWARWHDARIEVERRETETMRVVSPEAWGHAISAAGAVSVKPVGENAFEVSSVFPGSLYLLKKAPPPVTLPCDLTKREFIRSYVSHQGAQLQSPRHAGGNVGEGTVGEVTKRGFSVHPPNRGRTLMEFPLTLPESPVSFRADVGLRDESESEGCLFIVTVTGEEVARELMIPGEWRAIEADLSRWSGRAVVLSLVTDSDTTYHCDWAVWGEARLDGE